jgi:hypothetical protein
MKDEMPKNFAYGFAAFIWMVCTNASLAAILHDAMRMTTPYRGSTVVCMLILFPLLASIAIGNAVGK